MTRDQLLAELLRRSNGKIGGFRDGQWESIDAVANRGERRLVVQRTGWGKSVVYFDATIVLRAAGAGPTLVISPLLALVRDQIRAAREDFGLEARSYHSQNADEWDAITTVPGYPGDPDADRAAERRQAEAVDPWRLRGSCPLAP